MLHHCYILILEGNYVHTSKATYELSMREIHQTGAESWGKETKHMIWFYACNSGTERELFSDRYYRYMQVYHSLYVTVSMIGYQMSATLTKNIGFIYLPTAQS